MPGKTQADRILDLEQLVVEQRVQLKLLEKTVQSLQDGQSQTHAWLHDLRRAHERDVAVLGRDVEELRRHAEKSGTTELKTDIVLLREKMTKVEAAQEKLGQRAWSVVPNISGAVVGGVIAAVVAFLVARLGK